MASARHVQRLYDRQAATYDARTASRRLDALRAALFVHASGDVLELGVGTGATFAHYPGTLRSLTALEISGEMLARAQARTANLPFPVRLVQHDYQTLPFEAASFDTVTSSLGLCGIPDPAHLFGEVRRVLRPGGHLLALEHVRPPQAWLGLLSDGIDPLFEHVVGCHANRPTPRLLREAGFTVDVLERRLAGLLVTLRATPT
ncbi:ubiquinone/menaquinone biosynthesis C-methylase UbiE [Deinococcus metalli]|uniref:Methyltransferase type 11 n=1 Tax=Deinococcus metalli TaxID=1141878 RepID=A0A7W8KB39_9DEIO|nr:methyltransferase domain-containing protein [Deinococcus metalli]MBB5374670.1 ubiquinone/menaquinone biosynthesis C-methylase UbiE [Deinococcus metalli]GHF34571.1 methyltransferase type 11 [Deinococcus metalli]